MNHHVLEKPTLADILSALSYALDITEGQSQGHAVRTCLISTHIARAMGLSEADLERVFYAALLKDAGSSATATRFLHVFNDEPDASEQGWLSSLFGSEPPSVDVLDKVTDVRHGRAKEIVQQLGLDQETAYATFCIDERWDGSGGPHHLRGDAIPLGARIIGVSQAIDLFTASHGLSAAYTMLESRRGTWFDPAVVDTALSLRQDECLWSAHTRHRHANPPSLIPPGGEKVATEAGIDDVCLAFARIIDAKSSFTGQHSTRVAAIAVAAAGRLGIRQTTTLRRAGLLHDIGKLGIPVSILEMPGPLTDYERGIVAKHPRHSQEILGRIRGFQRISELAGAHHERLDGNGYWQGRARREIDLEMRLLAAADVYDALVSDRPYRSALPPKKVIEIMLDDVGLDRDCVGAIRDTI